MANRPVYLIEQDEVVKKDVEFTWYPGFSLSQKQKSVNSHHNEATKLLKISPENILEISTKSKHSIGKKLSAFNLRLLVNENYYPLESVFQSSKTFEYGGPYEDILFLDPISAKKDNRLNNSGRLVSFRFLDEKWSKEPKTLFYDWLYINSVYANPELHREIIKYKAFTDIEFNPKISYNCQAKSAALYVSLHNKGMLDKVVSDRELYVNLFSKQDYTQLKLL